MFLVTKGIDVFVNNTMYQRITSLRLKEAAYVDFTHTNESGKTEVIKQYNKQVNEHEVSIRRVYLDFNRDRETTIEQVLDGTYDDYASLILPVSDGDALDIVLWKPPTHELTTTIESYLRDRTNIQTLSVPQVEADMLIDCGAVEHNCLVLLCSDFDTEKQSDIFVNIIEPLRFRGGQIRVVEKTNSIETGFLNIVGVWYAKCYANGEVGI